MADQEFLDHAAGTAIAGFTLAQLSFWALLQSGLLSKGDAEKMLREAIKANQGGGPANHAAAAKLQGVLDNVSVSEPRRTQ